MMGIPGCPSPHAFRPAIAADLMATMAGGPMLTTKRSCPIPQRNPATRVVGDVRQLAQQDYEHLLAFRTGLRRFLHWSQAQAREVGLTPAQHQLLLAVKGHPGAEGPTVGDLAGYLLLRHHSAVELVDRAEAAQLVERWGDDNDGRLTRVRLTPDGEKRLNRLVPAHLDELQHLASVLGQLATEWNSPGHN